LQKPLDTGPVEGNGILHPKNEKSPNSKSPRFELKIESRGSNQILRPLQLSVQILKGAAEIVFLFGN
jgi:hypothetical protein